MFSKNKIRYGLMDKSSGVQVGIVILSEGQDIPDLSQMELKICEPETRVDEKQDEATQQTFNTTNNGIPKKDNRLPKNKRLFPKSESLVPKNESPVPEKESQVLKNQSFIPTYAIQKSKSEGPIMTNKTEPLKKIVSQLALRVV